MKSTSRGDQGKRHCALNSMWSSLPIHDFADWTKDAGALHRPGITKDTYSLVRFVKFQRGRTWVGGQTAGCGLTSAARGNVWKVLLKLGHNPVLEITRLGLQSRCISQYVQ